MPSSIPSVEASFSPRRTRSLPPPSRDSSCPVSGRRGWQATSIRPKGSPGPTSISPARSVRSWACRWSRSTPRSSTTMSMERTTHGTTTRPTCTRASSGWRRTASTLSTHARTMTDASPSTAFRSFVLADAAAPTATTHRPTKAGMPSTSALETAAAGRDATTTGAASDTSPRGKGL